MDHLAFSSSDAPVSRPIPSGRPDLEQRRRSIAGMGPIIVAPRREFDVGHATVFNGTRPTLVLNGRPKNQANLLGAKKTVFNVQKRVI